MTSLNQVKKFLEDIATAHKQINSFGLGDLSDYNAMENVQYPSMWVNVLPSSVSGTVLNLRLYMAFMDRLDKDNSNFLHVLSDTQQTALDVIALLKSKEYEDYFDIENDFSLEDFREPRFDDEVAGWGVEFTVKISYLSDRCAVPTTGEVTVNPLCPNVTIKDEEGNVITTVAAGGIYIDTAGTCEDATVENSDVSYTDTVEAGETLVLPNEVINVYVNGVLNQIASYIPLSGQVINIS